MNDDMPTRFEAMTRAGRLRDVLSDCLPHPFVSYLLHNRRRHLSPFRSFFERVLSVSSPFPRLRALAQNIVLAQELSWPARHFRALPHPRDCRFSTSNDWLEPVIAALFAEPATRRLWMQAVDEQVAQRSTHLLQAIDQAAHTQPLPLCQEVVLVGAGPLACLLSSLLAPLYRVTVITEETALGRPWRQRPLFQNSSASFTDGTLPPLPLMGGPTTRLIGWHLFNLFDTSLLTEAAEDIKRVHCADGGSKAYASGFIYGELIASNLVLSVDEVLLHQRVEAKETTRLTDRSLRLTLIDTRDGTRRSLRAQAVFFVTGPGPERSRLPDVRSQILYQQANEQVRRNLQKRARCLSWYREALLALESETQSSGVRAEMEWVRTMIQQTVGRIELPPVRTLSMLEALYAFWQEQTGAEPAALPDLFSAPTLAFIGNGDTARTLKELVDGTGPQRAYSQGVRPQPPRRATLYNEAATNAEQYIRTNRRRYAEVWTPGTTAIASKALRYRLVARKGGTVGVEVTHRDTSGMLRRRRYDALFDCTGLERATLAEQLEAAALSVQEIRDLDGAVVARGDEQGGLFLVGAAAGLPPEQLPSDLQRLLQRLQIKENTLALWVNAALAERLAYRYVVSHPPTKPGVFGGTLEQDHIW